MEIKVLKQGDRVIGVNSEFITVERKDRTVDVIPIYRDGNTLRINTEGIITIGYGNNTVSTVTEDGIEITTF